MTHYFTTITTNCDTSSESSNLSNIEHRAVIKYFVKKGKTPKEIFEDMISVLQESARRPVTVVTEENVRKIEKLVLADRRIKLWQIAEELQISKKRVGEIIHEHMNMRKISARWVPKMLTPFDKQWRLQTSTRGSRTEATWEVIARSAVLQDNASVHTARVSRQALKDTGFSEIDHPPYSPDLAPSDYFLFSNLIKELRGRRFVDDNQMKMAVKPF
ncbi:Histone-lysine N-methyltransferase SETMAR [Eumeta japonica]|uniref:Histone-lysine N-methyltransferase SETMAR n=1 Tax=Eumeta variegata TaxID=151549 RepID=A0A4C1WLB3_EUMVA|nr:Histone-lysine N-methyltransferase SETMAR [Eumeta japonica]